MAVGSRQVQASLGVNFLFLSSHFLLPTFHRRLPPPDCPLRPLPTFICKRDGGMVWMMGKMGGRLRENLGLPTEPMIVDLRSVAAAHNRWRAESNKSEDAIMLTSRERVIRTLATSRSIAHRAICGRCRASKRPVATKSPRCVRVSRRLREARLQVAPRRAGQGAALRSRSVYRCLGLDVARGPGRDHGGSQAASLGRPGGDRRLPAAAGATGSHEVLPGGSGLCRHQPLRAGVDRNPAFRAIAVSPRSGGDLHGPGRRRRTRSAGCCR